MKLLKWLDDYFEEGILAVLMSVTSIIVFLQVIMRFVFRNSLTWSEELARYLFIWMIYIGVSYGIKKRSHLAVDALDSLFGKKGILITNTIHDMFLMAFMVTMTYFGFDIVLRATRVSAALGLPMKYVYLAPVVGFGLSIIRIIQRNIIDYKDFNKTDI